MMSVKTHFLLLVFIALHSTHTNRISFVSADITRIFVVANSTIPRNRTSYYERIVSNTTDDVTIAITSDFDYFIVQVHTYDKTVSLLNGTNGSYVAGTDIGLVQHKVPAIVSYNFFLNDFRQRVEYVVSVIPYGFEDPIPGGCMTNSQSLPILRAAYNKDVVRVKLQQASVGIDCKRSDVKLEIFYLHIPRTYNKTAYFNTLRQMATVEDIETNGYKVSNIFPFDTQRSFVNYVGLGRVFGVVAYWKNYSAAYVSVVSYGCNFGTDSCYEGKAIGIAIGTLYMLISLMACFRLGKAIAILCAMTVCVHIIAPLVSNDVSVLTISISLLVTLVVGLALFYFNCDVFNAAIASYVLGCLFASFFFGFATISQITICYWLVHLSCCILYFIAFKTDPSLIYVVLRLLCVFSISIFAGGDFQYVILNNKFYFTLNYYQPVAVNIV